MSHIRIPWTVIDSHLATVGPSAFAVLVAIMRHADKHGECWPSIATLSRATSLCRTAVKQAIVKLIDANLVTKHPRTNAAGDQDTNAYKLLLGGGSFSDLPRSESDPRVGRLTTEGGSLNDHRTNYIELIPIEPRRGKAVDVVLPANLQTKEFSAAWSRWTLHRAEKRKPLTPSTTEAQLAKLAAWGPVRATQAIEASIEAGWTGIFEPTQNGNGKSHHTPPPPRPMKPPVRRTPLGATANG